MPPLSADACRAALEDALRAGSIPTLDDVSETLLDEALRDLVRRHGAAAGPLVRRLAEMATPKTARKVARRALYRLGQAGVELPPPSAAPVAPFVRRQREQAVRAWLSGIDGSGSRAAWIVFEGGTGGERRLCSLILNDEAGILEVAGGPITKKRLEAELASLRESQKLPWVETAPGRACVLVAEALALHERARTSPPPEFQRFRALFEGVAPPPAPAAGGEVDAALLARSGELLLMPEMLGWFVDPAAVQEDAVARLEMQDSRLIVSDQIKSERGAAIVDRAIARVFDAEARQRFARRLVEMALVFRATDREEPARVAETAAAALRDEARPSEGIPLVRALALRGLEVAGEVTLGRVKLEDVSRAPGSRSRA